mmetsp:Transcript_22019/g.56188  ORF Transcript_22019/g.56188 Transcript_22019/m.56188 type:complete len:303 (+) Transcript_22019:223-1131(+)
MAACVASVRIPLSNSRVPLGAALPDGVRAKLTAARSAGSACAPASESDRMVRHREHASRSVSTDSLPRGLKERSRHVRPDVARVVSADASAHPPTSPISHDRTSSVCRAREAFSACEREPAPTSLTALCESSTRRSRRWMAISSATKDVPAAPRPVLGSRSSARVRWPKQPSQRRLAPASPRAWYPERSMSAGRWVLRVRRTLFNRWSEGGGGGGRLGSALAGCAAAAALAVDAGGSKCGAITGSLKASTAMSSIGFFFRSAGSPNPSITSLTASRSASIITRPCRTWLSATHIGALHGSIA